MGQFYNVTNVVTEVQIQNLCTNEIHQSLLKHLADVSA